MLKKPTQLSQPALLVLLAVFGFCPTFPQKAMAQKNTVIAFPPESIEAWKEYMRNYPTVLAQYQKEQKVVQQAAKRVTPSSEKNMDEFLKAYPFLQKDLQEVREVQDIQKTIADSPVKNSDPSLKQSVDTTPRLQVAEDKDKKTGINVFFVAKNGIPWCSPHGCNLDVYVDTGAGYEKAGSFIVARDLYISRIDKNLFLFAGPPGDARTVEWVLKNNRFITFRPPSPEPPSQAFLEWKTEQQQAGKWPPL